MMVMDDHPGDPASEAVSEVPDRRATSLVQDVDAAIQMHHGQTPMGGHVAQDVFELVRRIGVYLGRDAHLGEAEPGEFEQRVVPGDALLEQGMNRFRYHLRRGGSCVTGFVEASRTIHYPHSPVAGVPGRVLHESHALIDSRPPGAAAPSPAGSHRPCAAWSA